MEVVALFFAALVSVLIAEKTIYCSLYSLFQTRIVTLLREVNEVKRESAEEGQDQVEDEQYTSAIRQ